MDHAPRDAIKLKASRPNLLLLQQHAYRKSFEGVQHIIQLELA